MKKNHPETTITITISLTINPSPTVTVLIGREASGGSAHSGGPTKGYQLGLGLGLRVGVGVEDSG